MDDISKVPTDGRSDPVEDFVRHFSSPERLDDPKFSFSDILKGEFSDSLKNLSEAGRAVGELVLDGYKSAQDAFVRAEPYNRSVLKSMTGEAVPLALSAAGVPEAQEFVRAQGALTIEFASRAFNGLGLSHLVGLPEASRMGSMLHNDLLPWFNSLTTSDQMVFVAGATVIAGAGVMAANMGWQLVEKTGIVDMVREFASEAKDEMKAVAGRALVSLGTQIAGTEMK